ncbi:MAG: peptide chain release factor 1 [Ruminococcaceae bacterium]|nr:peptide chain release factor 1 [Oscillospiraceae bacterium]
MLRKLNQVIERYQLLEHTLALPESVSDAMRYSALLKEYSSLTPMVEKIREYQCAAQQLEEASSILDSESDAEMRSLADEILHTEREHIGRLENELKIMLLPPDPRDEKNVVMEIRAGAGGEEAALFAGVLYRMYVMYAESCGYRCEIAGVNETGLGGYREITFLVSGKGAYSHFKYESGVHRVQRVPETESSGRIHTSTATVAVLPEAEEVSVEIDAGDLQIDTIKSTGAGGQHINKTESAIRLIHKPSGIVIECQDERSQLRNKEKAMRLLRAKLLDQKEREQKDALDSSRRTQVGSGDRSERVRTYNYPQGRITDHRIGMTLYTLDSFLNGDIEEIVSALASAEAAEKLKENGMSL